ncbi:hypothetical protein BGZ94_005644 [Podila epigama]|nr:hypothetical protein BGZ94_005644 [Podila epigama]
MDPLLETNNNEKKVPKELESLSIFLMPTSLINSLTPQAPSDPTVPAAQLVPLTTSRLSQLEEDDQSLTTGRATPTSLDSASPSCRICGIPQFDSVEKQREHVKLDWHRYNLKQKLLDKTAKPLSEQQFENMIQDLSSISGSDDSSEEDSANSGTDNAVVKTRSAPTTTTKDSDTDNTHGQDQEAMVLSLMKKLELTVRQNQRAKNQDPVLLHQQQQLEQQLQEARSSPMIWLTSNQYDQTLRLGVYKNALPNKGQCDNITEYLKSLQLPAAPASVKKSRRANKHETRAKDASETVSEPTPKDPSIANKGESGENEEEDEDKEETEEIVDQGQDWLAYQMQAKQQPAKTLLAAKPETRARYWTLVLIGGGHFAGVVMDLAGQVSTHGRDMKVVAHKTFHRYTVRKKQGGSQASHGIANSAGARIRMYNEEALKLEVRELLDSWSQWINESECVFVHSPGNNKRVLFYEGSVISTADKQGRLRSIPFMTRRPTLSELKRAYMELSSVKVSIVSKEALEHQANMDKRALEKVMELSKGSKSSGSSAADTQQPAATMGEAPAEILKLIDLIKKGRAEAVSSHIIKHNVDAAALLPVSNSTEYDMRRTPTLLHLASHHGHPQVVKILLEKHNADPTVTSARALDQQDPSDELNDPSGFAAAATSLTAYDVAKDKETRNAFRRAMALLPDKWDWVGQAHVPSALTPEMEAEQERKAKEKTRKLLEAERERKKTREASRPTTPVGNNTKTSVTSSSSPSSSSLTSASLMSKNLASASAANSHLSPELRMRLERERRANAAEARMTAMRQAEAVRRAVQEGKNVCVACGTSLDNKTPFDKFGRKFCTTDCVSKGPA